MQRPGPWRPICRVISRCSSARPNKSELKQMLLMFRGIPPLERAINAAAAGVNSGCWKSYPAVRKR